MRLFLPSVAALSLVASSFAFHFQAPKATTRARGLVMVREAQLEE